MRMKPPYSAMVNTPLKKKSHPMRNLIEGGPKVSNRCAIVLALRFTPPPTKRRFPRNETHVLEMRLSCHHVMRFGRILNEIEGKPPVLPLFLEFRQPFATQPRRTLMYFRTFG